MKTPQEHSMDLRRETSIVYCERCHTADALPDDEWCQRCIDAQDELDSDPLAETLIDIARTRIEHEAWMRDQLALLTDDERNEIVREGAL